MKGAKLTGLWKNKSKAGKHYLAGNLGPSRLLVLPNDRKQKDNEPDYNVWLVPRENQGKNGKEEGEEVPL